METFLIRALQLILSLSILVILHEFGHFGFARLFKVRVEKFYMFFNPRISLVRAKKINGKWQVKFLAPNVPYNERPKLDADGDPIHDAKGKVVTETIPLEELADDDWRKYPESTEWGIGWLPLGGYCKIAGMIDETTDKSQLSAEPQQWEYRSRSVWQRLPIIIGGVLVNFILAMVIYSAILFTWGREYIPFQQAKYGLQYSEVLQKAGFQNGDQILLINGEHVEQRADAIEKILIEKKQNISVLRNGEELTIQLPSDISQQILAAEEPDLISVRYPFVVAEVSKGDAAAKSGFQAGDSIIGVNNKEMFAFQDISRELYANRNKSIEVDFIRNGSTMKATLALPESGKMGVSVFKITHFIQSKKIEYDFIASIPAGISLGWETLTSYIKQFGLVFSKEGAKQIGGFGAIGKMFSPVWDWQSFWAMTALLSIVLAFMNFLPIPGLDGGYVLFLLYEMFTGRKPNDKFLEYAQTIGMMLLFALLIYANGNDIFKAIFK